MRKLLKEAAWLAVIIEAAAPFAAAWSLGPYAYNVTQYRVEDLGRAPGVHMVVFPLIAVCLMAAAWFSLRQKADPVRLALRWLPLLFCWAVFLRRSAGWEAFFLEPLVLAVSVAAAVVTTVVLSAKETGSDSAAGEAGRRASSLSLWALAAVTIAAAVWFYVVQAGFLEELSYGWRDAGLYYMRVKNTALGTGFLRETRLHAPFYDHFTPGLLFLVPLYWVVRSYRLIMAAQAVALAALGPCVYVYARGRGLSKNASALLGAAALVHPSISQMAYSFSYGFHPITLAMPAVVLSIHFWEKRRWWAFAAAAAFAASFEETLFPLYAGLALVTFFAPGVCGSRGASLDDAAGGGGEKAARAAALVLLAVSVGLFFVVTKLVMPAFAGKGYFQMAKYAHLGTSVFEILLSPFTRPGVFWGLLFSERSVVFMALVLGGMGFLPLLAPRRLFYPVVVTVFVMLLDNPDVKSICFWYQSLILAAWLPAMAAGARKASAWLGSAARAASGVALGALVSAVILSHFHGLLPASRITMSFQGGGGGGNRSDAVAAGKELVRLASRLPTDARVLATFREAMLFVDTDLTPFEEWDGSTDFDVVVLDVASSWGQTKEDTRKALRTLLDSGSYDVMPMGTRAILTRKRTPQTKGGTE